jgi:hypothetical protein
MEHRLKRMGNQIKIARIINSKKNPKLKKKLLKTNLICVVRG